MKKTVKPLNKLGVLLKSLFTANDDPHGISLGFGLGVFLGMMPGTGPLAALFCAQFLRVNRAAAVFGAVLTNTWFSLLVMGFAVKLGALMTNVSWLQISQGFQAAFRPFNWHNLFQLWFYQLIYPVLLGFLALSAALAVAAYLAAFLALHLHRSLRSQTKTAGERPIK
ncbi:MAG: DUF2062 domain-containing protein [Deltaproteobacteria bacterium]